METIQVMLLGLLITTTAVAGVRNRDFLGRFERVENGKVICQAQLSRCERAWSLRKFNRFDIQYLDAAGDPIRGRALSGSSIQIIANTTDRFAVHEISAWFGRSEVDASIQKHADETFDFKIRAAFSSGFGTTRNEAECLGARLVRAWTVTPFWTKDTDCDLRRGD